MVVMAALGVNDIPPFPIFTGEVMHAEASLPLPTRLAA
jgi:hypothetical protein